MEAYLGDVSVKVRPDDVVEALVSCSNRGEREVDGRVVPAHYTDKVYSFTWERVVLWVSN